MANTINLYSSLSSNATVASLTANYGNGVALVSATSNVVAAEYNLTTSPLSVVRYLQSVSLSSTAYKTLSTYTFANTAGTGLSSGAGTLIVDRSYVGSTINLRVTDRTGFLTTIGSTVALTLTANGRQGWGTENMRLRNLGYF